MSRSFLEKAGLSCVCLLATAGVSACHDASSDPMAVLLTEETRSALATEAHLPTLASLAAEARAEESLSGPMDLWEDSWQRPLPEGRALRLEAYQAAAPRLAGALGRAGVEGSVASLDGVLDAAGSLDAESLGPRIAQHLELAREEQVAAATALREGREAEALVRSLQGSDILREVGPESVVRLLIDQADGALERLEDDGPRTAGVDLRRGERLIRGARLALESGDYVRAIRRAFYACQVLGVQPD